MSFSAFLAKSFGRHPLWLYEIVADGTTHRFATGREAVILDGSTWSAEPISHGRIVHGGDVAKDGLDVEFPASHPFVERFKGRQGVTDVTLRLLQGWRNDPDEETVVKFVGRFVSAQVGTTRMILRFETALTQFRQAVDAGVIQQPCRHVLYQEGCFADRAAFTVTDTVTAINGRRVTVTSASAQEADYYTGGILKYGAAERWILKQNGNILRLEDDIAALDDEFAANGTAEVEISAGCPLDRHTCDSRFDNIGNFGGFPWIRDNPFRRNVF